jgi:hypothetical protein
VAAATKLTAELRAEVERELAAGHPVAVVAQRHGIGRRTLGRWLAEGRVVRREQAAAPAATGAAAVEEVSLDERLQRAEPGLVAAIIAASQRGSWQASAWLLERIAPDRWAKPQRREPGLRQPRKPDPIWGELDELAVRRAAQNWRRS